MTRKKGFFVLAMLVYLIAWFVPVIKDGSTLADGRLPGFEALTVALGPITEMHGSDGVLRPVLSVLSGLTNGVMLLALVLLARRPPRAAVAMAWSLGLAALLNTYWQFEIGLKADLRIGYYLWVGAFVLLAVHARAVAHIAASGATDAEPRAGAST